MKYLGRVSRSGNSTVVTVPQALLRLVGLRPGMGVVLEGLENHRILVRPLEAADLEASAQLQVRTGVLNRVAS